MFWRLVPGTLEGHDMDGVAGVSFRPDPKKRCNHQSLDNLRRTLNLLTLQSKLGGCTMMKVERCTGAFWYDVNFVVKARRPRRLHNVQFCHTLSLSLYRHFTTVSMDFSSIVMTTSRPYFKLFRGITLLQGSTFQALPKNYIFFLNGGGLKKIVPPFYPLLSAIYIYIYLWFEL